MSKTARHEVDLNNLPPLTEAQNAEIETLATMPDEQIDTSDIPELDDQFWANAQLVEPDGTQQVTLRVKKSVLEAYKATGKGYQTRMNAILRRAMLADLDRRN